MTDMGCQKEKTNTNANMWGVNAPFSLTFNFGYDIEEKMKMMYGNLFR